MGDSDQIWINSNAQITKAFKTTDIPFLNQNFITLRQCIKCLKIWNAPFEIDLFQHLSECPKIIKIEAFLPNHQIDQTFTDISEKNAYSLNPVFPNDQKEQDPIDQNKHININNDEIEMEIKRISKLGSLSEGTIKQYKGPMRKFYQWLWKKGKHKPNASDIILYIQSQNPTLHDPKGTARIKKTEKIFFKEEQKNFIKETKFFLQEGQIRQPHQSWDLFMIQKFISDLIYYNMEILAFRLYILHHLGARVSELEQITFQRICDGTVIYIPKKQKKKVREQKGYLKCRKMSQMQQLNSCQVIKLKKK